MSGWLRHFALNAQVRTGLGSQVVVWAVIAAVALTVALVFLLIAAFVWLADRYDSLTAGLVLGGVFALIALIVGGLAIGGVFGGDDKENTASTSTTPAPAATTPAPTTPAATTPPPAAAMPEPPPEEPSEPSGGGYPPGFIDKLVDSFSDTVVREMRFAGWFR